MIQRVQTIYLLLIVALLSAMFFLPLAVLQSADAIYSFDVSGMHDVKIQSLPELIYPTWALFALTAVMVVVAFMTIFMYKNRVLQIRLSVFNAILMICFYALFAFFIWTIKDTVAVTLHVKFALSFPLVSLIFDYLAIRNIGADEVLVRSLNRLR